MFFGVFTFRYKNRFLVFWYKRFGLIPVSYHFITNDLDKTHISCVLSKTFLTKHKFRFFSWLRIWQNTTFWCLCYNVLDKNHISCVLVKMVVTKTTIRFFWLHHIWSHAFYKTTIWLVFPILTQNHNLKP
jgi:hypothetical protein